MMNYKMNVRYDGTKYDGWQRQGNTQNTIQGKIEAVLGKMLGHKVEVHGSGRTDKGVHAISQTVSFKINTERSCDEIMGYLNEYLPEDVAVTELTEAEERFHARLCAKRKTYVYRIWNSSVHNVFERNYLYAVSEKLNIEQMKKAAKLFEGEHDFLGFSSVKKTKKSTIRTIYKAEVITFGDEIRLVFEGDGFLYNMVRIISGTLLEIGKGIRGEESINEVFETKKRTLAGETLPARGLTLVGVKY